MKHCFLAIVVYLFTYSSALAVPTVNDPNLSVTQLVSGLSAPTTMAFIGASDILVLQKNNGQVRRIINGVLQGSSVLTVNVDNSSERGLLGIALHPDFPATPSVYLYFTESSGGAAVGNRVYRYTWTGSALTSPQLIIDLPVTLGPNHDGGIIIFGPDRKLYIVIGDLNRNGQLQNFPAGPAPDDTSVILRLNDDGTTPSDNPFFTQGGNVARYFAYGIRNSFGMAFDPVTDKLWITHNGPESFDEIDLVEPGFNSGWEQIMGPASSTSGLFVLPGSHYADPKFSWLNTVGPTGIAFLNSAALGAQYHNEAFVGDINNGNLYLFPVNNARDGFNLTGLLTDKVADNAGELNQVIFGTGFNGITDLKVGPDGLLYVVSFFDGAISVVKPASPGGAPAFGVSSLHDGEVGLAYDADLNIGGGTAPYVVKVTKGTLPAGLNIAGEDISGMPMVAGNSSLTLRVTDAGGVAATRTFKISVRKALGIATSSLKAGKINKPYNTTLKASGGKKPFDWSATGAPPWLSLDAATGKLTGTPPDAESTNVTFQVTDFLGKTVLRTLTLTIN